MGTPVAPLYKALRESGLGESVISDGLETVLQQVVPIKHEILLFSVSQQIFRIEICSRNFCLCVGLQAGNVLSWS
jgi:hypothetical protein